jgi:hypothetical protein
VNELKLIKKIEKWNNKDTRVYPCSNELRQNLKVFGRIDIATNLK